MTRSICASSSSIVVDSWGRLEKEIRPYKISIHLSSETLLETKFIADMDTAATTNRRGLILHDAGNFEAAVENFREALQLDPALVPAWFALGRALRRLERLEDAETAFRKALQLDAAYVPAWNGLGNTLQHQQRPGDAETAFREALRLEPTYVPAWNGLGNALRTMQRFNEAEIAYREALRLSPDYAFAHQNLGLLQRQGRLSAKPRQHS
jgi:Flp pilus assembly protein TadD